MNSNLNPENESTAVLIKAARTLEHLTEFIGKVYGTGLAVTFTCTCHSIASGYSEMAGENMNPLIPFAYALVCLREKESLLSYSQLEFLSSLKDDEFGTSEAIAPEVLVVLQDLRESIARMELGLLMEGKASLLDEAGDIISTYMNDL